MPWFRPVSVPPQLLEQLDRMDKHALSIAQRQDGLALALKQLGEDFARETRGIVKEQQDDYARLHSAIESVRNQLAGVRGGRPSKGSADADAQALELGRRMIQACATPEGALALAKDIEAQAALMERPQAANGRKPSPI